MNPNHVLAAAIFYLFTHRSDWRPNAAVATVVSSSVIDRVAAKVGRALVEVPVGFAVRARPSRRIARLGGEAARARRFCGAMARSGRPTRMDRHGPACGRAHGAHRPRSVRAYADLTRELGAPIYERIDAPATPDEKEMLLNLSAEDVTASELAGDPIRAAHDRTRQRRGHRRSESHHRARLVRRASVRH